VSDEAYNTPKVVVYTGTLWLTLWLRRIATTLACRCKSGIIGVRKPWPGRHAPLD